jgi:adenylylsulfate reductase subunit B
VKICPTQAVEVRGYADFVPMGASVTPLRSTDSIMWTVKFRNGTLKRFIMWTVKFRNGTLKRFKFLIRTTAEGAAVPDGGWDSGDTDLKSPTLYTEPSSLGLDSVWTK